MSNDVFKFKRFSISHAKSTMRVGTDGVLLGAWAVSDVDNACQSFRFLDIGCGCGLIAIMMAQRFSFSQVHGVDIDEPSIEEARYNAINSPFSDRLLFSCVDIRNFAAEKSRQRAFDLILCNPPYYTEHTLPPDERRSRARNVAHLSFEELIKSVKMLLAEDGKFSVVLPMQSKAFFVDEALKVELYVTRECVVRTTCIKSPKRVMLEFGNKPNEKIVLESLVLQYSDGKRSAEYSLLCQDFYL